MTRSRCGPNASSMIALRRASDSGVGDLKSLNWYTCPRNSYLLSPNRWYGSSS